MRHQLGSRDNFFSAACCPHGGLLPIPTNNVVEDKYFQFADIVNTVGAECAAAAAARKAKAIAQLHNVAAQLGFSRG